MKCYWNEEKNALLKSTRNIGFEEVQDHLEKGGKYTLEAHPNQTLYPHQYVLCFERDKYMFVIPCVPHLDGYFLKTIYPSRKMTKKHIS